MAKLIVASSSVKASRNKLCGTKHLKALPQCHQVHHRLPATRAIVILAETILAALAWKSWNIMEHSNNDANICKHHQTSVINPNMCKSSPSDAYSQLGSEHGRGQSSWQSCDCSGCSERCHCQSRCCRDGYCGDLGKIAESASVTISSNAVTTRRLRVKKW